MTKKNYTLKHFLLPLTTSINIYRRVVNNRNEVTFAVIYNGFFSAFAGPRRINHHSNHT